ncbi:MAG TPA: NADP-dependent malic enzyme [Bacteroidia bacterium]|jgi:malate dehydrogenase (oxaloacetate-decarboxylating)(NADP+)|nr:NADP-dependent malic enzyme [Bacteroidia bacterium]HQF27173.1 NADP-dependent malic enzyme [Bacteroidia bacterium]HQK96963.1 NADP-dependent malic enzyme [Bacteroidia bacterium]
MPDFNQEALDYHEAGRPGKIEVIPSKPYSTQRDLALAYSPGVAAPCLEIEKNPDDIYKYTAKGNLVAVISNGTAVLGLGNIGPMASKPVMEGKGLLFKIFADIDVFDIEIDQTNVDDFVKTVKAISPTFGGINLEDIKAPECFEIEKRLKAELKIPIMHDDQHGTAIISGAALINALEIAGKKIEDVKIVVNGAGASAISCTTLFVSLGAKLENIVMLDSHGVIRTDRDNLDIHKIRFATKRNINTLEEAMVGADVFVGLSKGNILKGEDLKTMAADPIVFAMANPDPEIKYEDALAARADVIMATGRSDYPNQVNNVIGFPFIFRGALDVRATQINEAMKLAAVYAIAQLAKEPVPEIVNLAYNKRNISFGKEYIIPKPLDPRLIHTISPAVAKAAIDSGVALKPITNWTAYESELKKRLGLDNKLIRVITSKAKQNPKRIVFAEADTYKILKAAQIVSEEGIAKPILLGNKTKIEALIKEHNLRLNDIAIIDPREEADMLHDFAEKFFEKRKRRGFTLYESRKIMQERNYYGAMMVETGQADAMISGLTRNYTETIKPALRVIGTKSATSKVAGMYIMITKDGPVFFADTTININPTVEELVEITLLTADAVRQFNIVPRIGLLSYSNFGSSNTESAIKMRKAVEILHAKYPDLIVDGEIQANFAFNQHLLKDNFPFSDLAEGGVNTLIFPNLDSGNIAYKLLQTVGAAEAIGPVLLGMKKPVHILQLGSSVREIVNMVTIAVVDAQSRVPNNDVKPESVNA